MIATTTIADELGGTVFGRLMLRLLQKMEDMQQTLQVHSSMLQSIHRAINISGTTPAQLPEGAEFPLNTLDDIDGLEVKLTDASLRSALVRMMWHGTKLRSNIITEVLRNFMDWSVYLAETKQFTVSFTCRLN